MMKKLLLLILFNQFFLKAGSQPGMFSDGRRIWQKPDSAPIEYDRNFKPRIVSQVNPKKGLTIPAQLPSQPVAQKPIAISSMLFQGSQQKIDMPAFWDFFENSDKKPVIKSGPLAEKLSELREPLRNFYESLGELKQEQPVAEQENIINKLQEIVGEVEESFINSSTIEDKHIFNTVVGLKKIVDGLQDAFQEDYGVGINSDAVQQAQQETLGLAENIYNEIQSREKKYADAEKKIQTVFRARREKRAQAANKIQEFARNSLEKKRERKKLEEAAKAQAELQEQRNQAALKIQSQFRARQARKKAAQAAVAKKQEQAARKIQAVMKAFVAKKRSEKEKAKQALARSEIDASLSKMLEAFKVDSLKTAIRAAVAFAILDKNPFVLRDEELVYKMIDDSKSIDELRIIVFTYREELDINIDAELANIEELSSQMKNDVLNEVLNN